MKRKSDERNCHTCAHRAGFYDECALTGYLCYTEVRHPSTSRCLPELKLWEPRRPWYIWVWRKFVGIKP